MSVSFFVRVVINPHADSDIFHIIIAILIIVIAFDDQVTHGSRVSGPEKK